MKYSHCDILTKIYVILNIIFDKIISKGEKKIEGYSPLIPKGTGVSAVQRIIGSYIPEKDLRNYLTGQGYETEKDLKEHYDDLMFALRA